MYSRIRHPETLRIDLTGGDWIIVKKFLTAGEARRIFARMIRRGDHGDQVDTLQVGLAKMCVYLVDWSITDADGQPVIIRGMDEDVIASILDSLDMDAFAEIHQAVEKHETAMDAIREEEKKILAGSILSNQIWPSLAPSDGGTNGSPS
jgi:hypothetical protein